MDGNIFQKYLSTTSFLSVHNSWDYPVSYLFLSQGWEFLVCYITRSFLDPYLCYVLTHTVYRNDHSVNSFRSHLRPSWKVCYLDVVVSFFFVLQRNSTGPLQSIHSFSPPSIPTFRPTRTHQLPVFETFKKKLTISRWLSENSWLSPHLFHPTVTETPILHWPNNSSFTCS